MGLAVSVSLTIRIVEIPQFHVVRVRPNSLLDRVEAGGLEARKNNGKQEWYTEGERYTEGEKDLFGRGRGMSVSRMSRQSVLKFKLVLT